LHDGTAYFGNCAAYAKFRERQARQTPAAKGNWGGDDVSDGILLHLNPVKSSAHGTPGEESGFASYSSSNVRIAPPDLIRSWQLEKTQQYSATAIFRFFRHLRSPSY
jgi:hypothetical protein